MKTTLTRKVVSYTALFEPAEEGGYVVRVPALPGCVTQGETLAEATAMAKDAIEGYLAVLKEEGQQIPQEPAKTIAKKVKVSPPASYVS